MISIAIIAADLALLRDFVRSIVDRDYSHTAIQAAGTLALLNVLAVSHFRMFSRPLRNQPFLIGFQAAGFATLVAYYVGCGLFLDASLGNRLVEMLDPITTLCLNFLFPLVYLGSILLLPMLSLALLGGLIVKRFFKRGSPTQPDRTMQGSGDDRSGGLVAPSDVTGPTSGLRISLAEP